MKKFSLLAVLSAVVLTNTAPIQAAVPTLQKVDDKKFVFYAPTKYQKAKNTYYQYFYQSPNKNEYGIRDSVAVTVKPLPKALPQPTKADCVEIEKIIRKDIERTLSNFDDVVVTPYETTTANKDNFAKDPTKRVVQYGCRIEYQIQLGQVSLFSQTKVLNKKGQKDLFVVTNFYSDVTDPDEVAVMMSGFDKFALK